jgi:hypothetical protein
MATEGIDGAGKSKMVKMTLNKDGQGGAADS